jgi:hypothetical protein
MKFFRDLTKSEEIEFREWAREHYVPNTEIKSFWHPVVQDECVRINRESEIKNSTYGKKES